MFEKHSIGDTIKILLATDVAFWRRELGSEERIFRLVNAMTDNQVRVCLFFVGSLAEEDKHKIQSLPLLQWQAVDDGRSLTINELVSLRGLRFFPKWLEKIFYREFGGGVRLPYFSSAKVGCAFRAFAASCKTHVLLVEYVRLTYLLDWCPDGHMMQTFLDTHDLMSRRCHSFKKIGIRHWIQIDEHEEAQAFSRFDGIIAIQPEEKAKILQMVPQSKVYCAGLDSSVTIMNSSLPLKPVIGYVGGRNQVNMRSLRWFLDMVWPRLHNSLPIMSFLVAGGVSSEVRSTDKGVQALGYLSDLKEFFSDISLLVNPVQAGGGIKVKNLDALACGIPVLTTPCGAEGFLPNNGIGLLVANGECEFYQTIFNLFRDYNQLIELKSQAVKYSLENLSRETAYGELFRAWGIWT